MQTKRFDILLSQIREAMGEALSTIRSNKMRSGLVIFGVMIGIASLMGMVATVAGLEKNIEETISGGDTPILSLVKADFIGGEGIDEFKKRKNFTMDDVRAIEKLPHVRGVEVELTDHLLIKYKDRKTQFIPVIGSNRNLLHVQSMSVGEGRYFTEDEQQRRHKVAVLGHSVGKSLFPDEDPIGKMIRISGKEYRVIGVFENRKTIFGGFAENFLVIPYTAFERDFMRRNQGPEINVIVEDFAYMQQVEDDLRALMRMRRKVPLGEKDDFAIIPIDAVVEFTKSITDQIALVLVVLASIALMVGGIGVMVIMLVSVTGRTHEIGIRKAIGASRAQITWQFLIEAATLSGIGGLLGLVAGTAVALLVSSLLDFAFLMPIGWVLFALLVSIGVGLFFGIFPAQRAARLDPVEALRYE